MKWGLAAVTMLALAGCDGPHVSGRVCIVVDLRYPQQCLGGQDVAGLAVEELGTGSRSVTDGDGYFRVDTPEELASATLRVAAGRTDRRTSLVAVDMARDAEPIVPVIATSLWTSYVTQMGGIDDATRAHVHVSFPPPGFAIASASVAGAAQLFYNQGTAFDWAATPHVDQSFAFVALGVAPASTSVSITGVDDRQIAIGEVPVEANTITWIDIALP